MDKTVALKNICKELNFFEQEHRYLPGNHATDPPEADSTSCAVTTYFRAIGLHALLGRQDEVNIAKMIRLPVHLAETIHKLKRTQRSMSAKQSREAKLEGIAEEMEISRDIIRRLSDLTSEPVSLHSPVKGKNDGCLEDFIKDETVPGIFNTVVNQSLAEQIRKIIATLTPREEKVLRLRFGIGEKDDHTLNQISRDFSLTSERVRQIQAKALQKLRNPKISGPLQCFMEG